MNENVLDTRRAANYIGVSYSTLCQWRMVGRGPRFIKPSSHKVVYRVSDLDAWLDQFSRGEASHA